MSERLTAEELAAIGNGHYSVHGQWCRVCGGAWPCAVKRLLSHIAALDVEAAALKARCAAAERVLSELRLRILEADALAVKDSDEDGFITAYHFQTGTWHRLLAYVNGDAYDALTKEPQP